MSKPGNPIEIQCLLFHDILFITGSTVVPFFLLVQTGCRAAKRDDFLYETKSLCKTLNGSWRLVLAPLKKNFFAVLLTTISMPPRNRRYIMRFTNQEII